MLERDFQNEVIRRIGRDIYGEGLRAGGEPPKQPDPSTFLRMFIDLDKSSNEFPSPTMDLAKGYSPLIPPSLQEKYKREADIDKYLKNMERLKKRGIV